MVVLNKQKKQTKKLMILPTNTWQKLFIVTGITVSFVSMYSCNVHAQSFGEKENVLIAQNLGGIVRKIPLEEVALPAMSSAKTATNAAFSQARIELKSDGSLIYILRGQNQQGFEVEVQVTPTGTLIQVDEQIESSGVPEIALKAFKKWAPNDQISSALTSSLITCST